MGCRAAGAVAAWFIVILAAVLDIILVPIGSLAWHIGELVVSLVIFIGWLGGIAYFMDITSHRLSRNTMIYYALMLGGFMASIVSLINITLRIDRFVTVLGRQAVMLMLSTVLLYLVCMPWIPILMNPVIKYLVQIQGRKGENTDGSR